MFMTVHMKFIAPNSEDPPAKCKPNILKSIPAPGCPIILDSGGYSVHPAAVPPSTNEASTSNIIDGGINHNDMLFNLGNAISTLPINIGKK